MMNGNLIAMVVHEDSSPSKRTKKAELKGSKRPKILTLAVPK